MHFIAKKSLDSFSKNWQERSPFPHIVIDEFFDSDIAYALEREIDSSPSDAWLEYRNALEIKSTCNDWNVFPSTTYKVLTELNSENFCRFLSERLFDSARLYSDSGLNGGGWHKHEVSGKLNPHLDYSLHPKLALERVLNIIIYLNSSWEPSCEGHLGFWSNGESGQPGELLSEVEPKFNRAVVFHTAMNSWHGLSRQVAGPTGFSRKSLAVYYLRDPEVGASERGKALFAPTPDQANDESVLDLIKKRSGITTARSAYHTEDDL